MKRLMKQKNQHAGEGAAGKPPQEPPQEPPSPRSLQYFQDILDVVLSLSDQEWRTLTSDMPSPGTKLQFACLCTRVITSVCRSAIQSYLPTLLRVVGTELVLEAEAKLEKRAEPAAMSSSSTTAPSPGHSAESSSVDPSELICSITEDFVREVKIAMQRAIFKVACYGASSQSRDWKEACSHVAVEMMNMLETKAKHSHQEDSPALREEQDKDALHPEAQSAASDVGRNLLKQQQECCPSLPSDNACSSTGPASQEKKEAPSTSQSTCRGVHKKVLGFLQGLRKPFPEKRRIFPVDQPPVGAELEGGTRTISPRFQLNVDSCVDEVIYKVVELFKSELRLSSSSTVPLYVSTSLPERPAVNLKAVKQKGFQTEAAQLVSDVLIKRLSSQTSRDESRQDFFGSSREMSFSSVYSASATDVEGAAVTVAETVVDALDRYVESKHSALTAANSRSDTLSCLDALSRLSVANISEEPSTSEKINDSNPFLVFRKVKDLLYDLLLGDQRTDPSGTATQTKPSALGMSQATPITSHHSESPVGSKTAPPDRKTDREVGATLLQGSSASVHGQNSDKWTGFTNVGNHLTEALTGSWSKMENPPPLLVKSECSERNLDSVLDVKPVGEAHTASSTAGTPVAEERLEILSVFSQEHETYTSSSCPNNESHSMAPAPVAAKKRSRRFRFIVLKKGPVINVRRKTSRKLCPAGLVSDSHQSPSTSGNLPEPSQTESRASMTPFKKTRQCLSRICSAVRRALPNPFQCMTSPS
ncbi:hypothetical protein MHYP_G00130190 [Metynnis hypsauchen]